MLGAVIRNGNNTLVVELPTATMDLQLKLSFILLIFRWTFSGDFVII